MNLALFCVLVAVMMISSVKTTTVEEAMATCRADSSKAPITGVLNMCFYCDRSCKMKTIRYPGGVQAYFERVTASMSKLFMDSKLCVAVKLQHLQETFALVNIQKFVNGKTGKSALSEANNQFWKAMNFPNWISKGKCDIGFLLIHDPPSFSDFGAGGVANMFQLCQSGATGVSEVFSNPDRMADRIAHEVGHMFGMYHDGGAVPSSITNLVSYDARFKPQVDKILAECAGNANCDNDKCVMVPALGSGASIDQFSKCSLAYERMYAKLAVLYPKWYSKKCISADEDLAGSAYPTDSKKRQVEDPPEEEFASGQEDVESLLKQLNEPVEEDEPVDSEAAKTSK